MQEINSVKVWTVAIATANDDLMGACVPQICAQFNSIMTDKAFLYQTDIAYLADLLASLQEEEEASEKLKLRTIAAWINAPTD